jgi:hypothetical protein
MTPREAQSAVNARFKSDVLSHYGAAVSRRVPLDDALTIASLIERETLNGNGMRLVSGIIWNRLFSGMNLQIDATVQYAKANEKSVSRWWPNVLPRDIYRRSPYNTYQNPGLPPTPIASPSVAAILAALNPIKTSCLFYFNDEAGTILCSDTYDEHVARVFSKEHVVTDLQEIFGIHLVFADAAGAECDDDAFLWFFLIRRIRNHDARRGHLFFFDRHHDDAITKGFDRYCEVWKLCHRMKEREEAEKIDDSFRAESLAVGSLEC